MIGNAARVSSEVDPNVERLVEGKPEGPWLDFA